MKGKGVKEEMGTRELVAAEKEQQVGLPGHPLGSDIPLGRATFKPVTQGVTDNEFWILKQEAGMEECSK